MASPIRSIQKQETVLQWNDVEHAKKWMLRDHNQHLTDAWLLIFSKLLAAYADHCCAPLWNKVAFWKSQHELESKKALRLAEENERLKRKLGRV